MSRKIDDTDATSPESIRSVLSPDLALYARMTEPERAVFDRKRKLYVERALYLLLLNGRLEHYTGDPPGLTANDVAWLNRMAHAVVAKRHAFGAPHAFGTCLSDKQFETVIRNREGGESIGHFANALSDLARVKKSEYNQNGSSTEESDRSRGDGARSQAAEIERPSFGAVIKSGGRTRATRNNKPRKRPEVDERGLGSLEHEDEPGDASVDDR